MYYNTHIQKPRNNSLQAPSKYLNSGNIRILIVYDEIG